MTNPTARTEYLTTHAAVQGLEDWMLETSADDSLTIQAIVNCALELRHDLRTQWGRYADGYELDTTAHRVALSTVANVLAWAATTTPSKEDNMTPTATNANGRTEYRNDQNDRGAIATPAGYTIFGFWDNGVLRCAHGKRSKVYADPCRAAAKWMAA